VIEDNLPHGGRLIDRLVVDEREKREIEERAKEYKTIFVNSRIISDIYMIAIGCFSPLEGFLCREDYENVIENMRLANGIVWPIPITLSISEEIKNTIKNEKIIGLYTQDDKELIAVMELEDIYLYNKEKEAKYVYRTTDVNHPGVDYLYSQDKYLVGGKIKVVKEPVYKEFRKYWFTPHQTRNIFNGRGWKKIVGFQTRNPIHRAHEFIIKTALEIVDGVFLNPLVGDTKKGDIPAEVRMRCYELILNNYFPKDKVFMGVYGAAMRYAGPREAVLHALVRKNFGCTHFIVGRDHAGVGNYYGPYDAQKIFEEFSYEEIGIIPLCFENAFWCRRCESMATIKTCPHHSEDRFSLSGTKVRELLAKGEKLPPEFTRPEVAKILTEWWKDCGNTFGSG